MIRRIRLSSIMVGLLFVALSCLPSYCSAADTGAGTTSGSGQDVVMLTWQEYQTIMQLSDASKADLLSYRKTTDSVLKRLDESEAALKLTSESLMTRNVELRKLEQNLNQRDTLYNQLLTESNNARESYNMQLKEEARTRRRIKRQRNFWECVTIGLVVASVYRAKK